MKLNEAAYASKPPSGWPAKKVMDTFFDVDKEWTAEMHQEDPGSHLYRATAYVVKEGFVVYEARYGEVVETLYQLNNDKYLYQNADQETEWEVEPSKFRAQETRAAYKGS